LKKKNGIDGTWNIHVQTEKCTQNIFWKNALGLTQRWTNIKMWFIWIAFK